jgi:hypothetical protein
MRPWLAALVLLVFSTAAHGQTSQCGDKETLLDCLNRLNDQAVAGAKKAADSENVKMESDKKLERDRKEIARKATSESAPGAADSLRDVLPLFFGALGLGNTSQEGDTLTLRFNPEFLQLGPSNPLGVKTLIYKPTLFEAMNKALPEGIRAEREATLKDKLGDFDDTELVLDWSRQSPRFGRKITEHRQLVDDTFQTLFDEALNATQTTGAKMLANVIAQLPPGSAAKSMVELSPADRQLVESALSAFVAELTARTQELQRRTEDSRFFDLADLVNNQPQLLASVNYRRRNDLVGPSQSSAKVSYEMGMANVNGLRSFCAGQKKAVSDPTCLSDYLAQFGKTLQDSPRLAISAQYSRDSAYHFALPDDHFSFELNRLQKWVASLSVGRYLRSNEQGTQTTRIDLQADYENVSGDAKRQPSRLVATATFSQKMSDDTSASFSIVYANRPEFLGAVDKALSARVGLKYKIDKKKESLSN